MHPLGDQVRRGDLNVDVGRTPGRTGLAAMLDAARLSLRDLAYLTVAVSDNAAADVLWDTVGLDTVNHTMADLGLTRTVAVHKVRDLMGALAEDTGQDSLIDPAMVARLRVLDPAFTSRSTAREMTALLAALWRGDACPGEHGAALRRLLGLQVWPHRLASGFPFDDVRVYGKTGTLPTLRHEGGVVEYPDGGRYAVAVFTRATATSISSPPPTPWLAPQPASPSTPCAPPRTGGLDRRDLGTADNGCPGQSTTTQDVRTKATG